MSGPQTQSLGQVFVQMVIASYYVTIRDKRQSINIILHMLLNLLLVAHFSCSSSMICTSVEADVVWGGREDRDEEEEEEEEEGWGAGGSRPWLPRMWVWGGEEGRGGEEGERAFGYTVYFGG